MNTKYTLLLLTLLIGMTACRKVTLGFTFEPAAPKAGERVTFTNLSSGGEDYIWNFGDNQTASTKNATHVYRQPGTYIISLRAKKSDKLTQQSITVGAPSLSITSSADTIPAYRHITFTANVWNPYSHSITYQWHLDDNTILTEGSLTEPAITVYFNLTGNSTILLDVTENGSTQTATHTVTVTNNAAPALLLQSAEQACYQRLYLPYFEQPRPLDYSRGQTLLENTTASLTLTDDMERKTYGGGDNGLYVYNTGNTDSVCITSQPVTALALVTSLNRLFYATAEGTYTLPLVHSANNRFTASPIQLNSLPAVSRIAFDEQPF